MIADYFAAETAIVARLQERVTAVDSAHVFTPFSVDGMLESSQPALCLHVVYSGDVVTASENGRTKSLVDQRWLVILAVRSAKAQLRDTSDIRAVAGPVITTVLDALQGWAPGEWMRPLGRVSGPPAGYSAAFAYFPFMFQGRIIT
jgi:hypothetical protein